MTKRRHKPQPKGDCEPIKCSYGGEIVAMQTQLKSLLVIIGFAAPALLAFGAWMVRGLYDVKLSLATFQASIAVIADVKGQLPVPDPVPKPETKPAVAMR